MVASEHIFISYKSQQRHLATMVRDELLTWGYKPWLDVDRLQPGTYWANEIDRALKTCRACLAVMTPLSLQSRHVTNEWDMAIMLGKPFIPLMFEYTEPHYKYIDVQYVDFTGENRQTPLSQLKACLDLESTEMNSGKSIDPYHDYLTHLYERINKYLAAKLITSLRDEEGQPEPIHLTTERTDEAVNVLFDKHTEIDPLFIIGDLPRETPEPLNNFAQACEYFQGRVLLLGEPGSGKTITLLQYARDAVVKRRQNKLAPLPVLGIVPTWNPDQQLSIGDWLATSYGTPANVSEVIAAGQALLLLDGLDELGAERPVDPKQPDGEVYDPRLRFLEKLPETNQIVLTCRSKDYADLDEKAPLNGAITLKPLTSEQLATYLHAQPELLAVVMKDQYLRHWLDTPLLLSYFAFGFEQMDAAQRQVITEMQNPSELGAAVFDQYVRGNYERTKAKPNSNVLFSIDDVYGVMGWVSVRNIVSPLATEGHLGNHSFVEKLSFSQILDFTALMIAMHVLVSTDEMGYQYVHIALRNHFAAGSAFGMVTDPDVENRLNAVYVFGETRDKRAIPHLNRCLSDNYGRVRATAAQVLGEIGDHTSLQGLLELSRDGDKVIRRIALDAIARTTDPRGTGVLIAELANPSPPVQQAVANGLSNIGDAAGDFLIAALLDANPIVRAQAAQILGKMGFQPAVPTLHILIHDDAEVSFNTRVCDFAIEALAKIEAQSP